MRSFFFYWKSLLFVSLAVTSFAIAENTPEPATVTAQREMWTRWEKLVQDSENHRMSLNRDERKRLLNVVSNNAVARLSALSVFDPPQNDQPRGEIGYCYGRAMAAHLIARKMGLEEQSMKKIFAAGDMQNGTVRWRFHMATLVLGDDEKYYAIDPIIPTMIHNYNQTHGTDLDPLDPVQPPFWIELIKANYDNTAKILETNPDLVDNPDFTGTIKFYVAPTDTMMVDMREVPATLDVENGERINEILFKPLSKGGFSAVYGQQGHAPLYYTVDSEEAARRYFMVRDEPLVEQFNFFQLTADIFYVKDDVLGRATRYYLYNGKQAGQTDFQHFSKGYFPSLLSSIETMTESFEDEE